MPRHYRTAARLSVASVCAIACGIDTFPLPDEFDAAFVTGQVCMPTNLATGTSEAGGAPQFPIRFDTCLYRCINLDPMTSVNSSWSCIGNQCQMVVLASGHARRVGGEEDCDARDLPDPPSGECIERSFPFMLSPPCCTTDAAGNNQYVTGDFQVIVPFLDLDQADEVVSRIKAGESPSVVVSDVVGNQNIPERQFVVNFDPSHPAVASSDDLGPGDCHSIPAP